MGDPHLFEFGVGDVARDERCRHAGDGFGAEQRRHVVEPQRAEGDVGHPEQIAGVLRGDGVVPDPRCEVGAVGLVADEVVAGLVATVAREVHPQLLVQVVLVAGEVRVAPQHAERDGTVLDLQVIPGQTVSTGQRLGTIGRPEQPRPPETIR